MDITDILLDTRVLTILIGILVPYFLYRYGTRNHNYWKEKGIPYVKPVPFFGSLWEGLRNSIELLDYERYQKFGKIYGHYEGSKPQIMAAEPELIKSVFVKDFQYFTNRRTFVTGQAIFDRMITALDGEDWKRVRSIISPTFSTGKIKKVTSIFKDCAKTLIENFQSAKGDPVDVLRFYGAFTMDIIASSAFSTKIDSHNNPENKFIKYAKLIFNQNLGFRFILFFIAPSIVRKLGISLFDPASIHFFKKVTLEIIEERRKTGQTRNDFLQLLMDAASEVAKEEQVDDKNDDIVANYGDDSINHQVFKSTTNKHLSMDELVAQCVIFFLAGYHTTATTLGISTYLLAVNQDTQDKLYSEIKDVLSQTHGELTYEALQNMKYLDNCISETLRIYPPATRAERTAGADYELGNTGITIPKGMVVGVPIYAMHRDPKLFPDPERFNPDRFNPEEREKQVPYSYLPFGVGPRNCVGMRFALVEIKVCLVYVFSTFHVQRCSETEVPLKFSQGTGLLKPDPIKLNLIPREDCPLKY